MDAENEKRLVSILERTISFVRYGETKNGALIALCTALIAGILKAAPPGSSSYPWLMSSVLVLTAAALVALESFLPMLEATKTWLAKYPDEQPNPLYFGHSARLDSEQFLEELYVDNGGERSHIELLYAQQITVNSRIAFQKFIKFKRAAMLVIAGTLLFGIGILLGFCH
jgi:hypothetical protein